MVGVKIARSVLAALAMAVMTTPAQAQNDQANPLVIAFAPFPPFSQLDPDGRRHGFLIDLAELIGSEIGVQIQHLDVETSQEFVQAQVSGQTQMIAGVARLPSLETTNVFSNSLVTERLRFTVLESRASEFENTAVTGQRIGIVPPALGSKDVPDTNQTVTFETPEAAIMALLVGNVDALLMPEQVVYTIARESRLDGRIRFVGAPVRTVDRYIALHESRADLLGPVNAAIERLKADGRLDSLLLRYNIVVPPPAPDVLKVGVFDLPPHMMIDPKGEATGFAVDVLRDVTSIAGLQIEFVPISIHSLTPGTTHDILPAISITDDRKQRMDFAFPIERSAFSIFMRANETTGVTGLSDLKDRKAAVLKVSLVNQLAAEAGLDNLVVYETGTEINDMIEDLIDGRVDAVLFEVSNVRSALRKGDWGDLVEEVTPPFFVSQRAPALRLGMGNVRERLNAVIPGYLISDDYAALRAAYFGEPVFWTRTRATLALAALGVGVLSILAFGGVAASRSRSRQADRVSAIRDELETIFNATTSGIVAMDETGQIIRVNIPARHMLGGISDPTPFPWPSAIKFLNAETLMPLDASADPVRRILSGNLLKSETHLITKAHDEDENRYVRVNSAFVEGEASALHVVLVIDDVSSEERNRQAVERKGRLDALGQLTGGIAHDFNNLLASQLYAVDLARTAKDPAERADFLELAAGSVERGRELTSRLLAFARKQPGLASARRTSVVFDDFQKLVRPMIEAHIEMTFAIDDPEMHHYCDQTQLETALMNLVLNSRDAILRSGRGNRIDIRARPVHAIHDDDIIEEPLDTLDHSSVDGSTYRYVEISVSDNGPGMDDETLARSTDPFFTTKGKTAGTGLGLAMVYGFVNQSEGDLRIYSEVNVGTTVQLTLPRGTSLGAREERMPEEIVSQGDGETLLVVEDEPRLLVMINHVLRDLGYETITATSGVEALDIVESGLKFDLLLTDIVMPGKIGGFELARRTRKLRPGVPVIYTSGYTGFNPSEMGDVQAPLLQKPASPGELARAIRQALKKV